MGAPRQSASRRLLTSPIAGGLALALVVVSTAFGLALARTGSIAGSLDYLEGLRIEVSPGSIEVPGDGHTQRTVTVHNGSGRAVTVIGYNAACSCVNVCGLPAQAPPGLGMPAHDHRS